MFNFRRVALYFNFLLTSKSRKGYGIHSPFIYNLARDVLNNRQFFPELARISNLRKTLAGSDDTLSYTDPGTGSRVFSPETRRVSDILKLASVREKYGRLLFLMVRKFKPRNIIELGTSLGIGTSYLSIANGPRKVYTIEASEPLIKAARKNFNFLELENIEILHGDFKSGLTALSNKPDSFDLVFFDGDHSRESTLNYFKLCLAKAGPDSIFIFDDIHWSKEMEEAWSKIIKHERVTCTVDLFQMGIVFFKNELVKQHFRIRY